MSEPTAAAIPTSADLRTGRPTKRLRPNTRPSDQQAFELESLMHDPSRPVRIPTLSESKTQKKSLPPPPEIVQNVQGSSAGAGSGEFHVYKASRRREYERLRAMDEEAEEEKMEGEWKERIEEIKRRDEERTGKNRRRREKKKLAKEKGKDEGKGGQNEIGDESGTGKETVTGGPVKGANGNGTMRENSGNGNGDVLVESTRDTGMGEGGITIHDDD